MVQEFLVGKMGIGYLSMYLRLKYVEIDVQVCLGNVLHIIDNFIFHAIGSLKSVFSCILSMATDEVPVFWCRDWFSDCLTHRLKNLCLKVFYLWAGLTENSKKKNPSNRLLVWSV